MACLYELTEAIKKLMILLDEGNLDPETIKDALNNSKESLKDKLENYCKFIRTLEADVDAYDKEIKRLTERRDATKNTIASAKNAMQEAMIIADQKSIKGDLFTISLRKSPVKVVMDEAYIENIPLDFLRLKDPEIDKTAIKKALQSDDEELKKSLEGIAHLDDSGISLSIR